MRTGRRRARDLGVRTWSDCYEGRIVFCPGCLAGDDIMNLRRACRSIGIGAGTSVALTVGVFTLERLREAYFFAFLRT